MHAEWDKQRVFVAGASGAIGRSLCRLLVDAGWQVTGTTRSPEKAGLLQSLGVIPAVVDVYDESALQEHMHRAAPDVVVHQLTDLAGIDDPQQTQAVLARNARIRTEGTRNLVAAATAAGARRMVAQSIAFVYAPGPQPHNEDAPLALDDAKLGQTARAVSSLEEQVLAAPFEGVVLRYGRLYGPGTGIAAPSGPAPLHIGAAADATRRAMTQGEPGIYNIAEEDGTVSCAKAARLLGWNAAFRLE